MTTTMVKKDMMTMTKKDMMTMTKKDMMTMTIMVDMKAMATVLMILTFGLTQIESPMQQSL